MRKIATNMTLLVAVIVAAGIAAGPAQAQQGRKNPMKGFDLNADGQVTLQELEMARLELFSRADINRDGALDRGEFTQIQQAGSSRRGGRGKVEKFEHADENYDGLITRAEFRSGARRMMYSLDQNGDFRLDESDFKRR